MFEMIAREKGCPVCEFQFTSGDHVYKTLKMEFNDDHSQMITYVLCGVCGMCYLLSYPPQREWYEFYEKQMDERGVTYLGDVIRAARLYVEFQPLVVSGEMSKVLSFGSGRGYLESHLSEHGVKIMGVDYRQSKWGGFDAIEPELFMKHTFVPQFDHVLMIHSLEHLIDPVPILEKLYKALLPGGRLVVEVPSFGHPSTYTISHPSIFSKYTLEHVVGLAGFETVGIRQLDVSNERVRSNIVLNAIFVKPEEEDEELLEEA